MKIEVRQKSKEVFFATLESGDVFWHEDVLLLKTSGNCTAVGLETGDLYEITGSDRVIPMPTAKVVV